MTLQEFVDIRDFNYFKEQKLLKLENIDEIDKYYNVRYYSSHCKPFYHCDPIFNSAINSNQFRYAVVEFEDDEVMFVFKVIQIIKTRQIRVIDVPISINGNKNNENAVIDKLKSLSFVKIVFKKEFVNEHLSNDEVYIEYSDYFYDLSLERHNFNSGKFKSKNGINKMLNNSDFKVVLKDSFLKEELVNIRTVWKNGMSNNGSTVSKSNDNLFYKFTGFRNDNIKHICIYYKNNLISLQSFIVHEDKGYADCLYINHLGRNYGETDSELKRVLKNICDIQNYFAYNMLGIERLYIAGCRPEEKRLLAHKERISDGKQLYYIDHNKQ